MIISSTSHLFTRFQPPIYKVTHLYWAKPHWITHSVCLSFQTFPSCSRNPGLFGCVEAVFREAWQRVSTISRSKFQKHRPSPILSKTIWLDRAQLGDLVAKKIGEIWSCSWVVISQTMFHRGWYRGMCLSFTPKWRWNALPCGYWMMILFAGKRLWSAAVSHRLNGHLLFSPPLFLPASVSQPLTIYMLL
jgi:hypothetical protein